MSIDLIDVYPPSHDKIEHLYQILLQRQEEPETNIFFKEAPSRPEHTDFVLRRPYPHWYLINEDKREWVGAVYITFNAELGIFVEPNHRRRGIAKQALEMIIQMHPHPKFIANISAANDGSLKLFGSLGFNEKARYVITTRES